MVESIVQLDHIFGSLADPTRRDILRRVSKAPLSVSQIAKPYQRRLSLAAVSKHLQILHRARLIHKHRHGKGYLVTLEAGTMKEANAYIRQYEKMWNQRLDRLEQYLKNNP